MTSLNQKGKTRKTSAETRQKTAVSYNGNVQVANTEAFQLYDLIVSHFFGKDAFYEANDARLVRLSTLVNAVVASGNLHFVANAVVHARHYMNMRSMPLVLAVHFAKALRDQNKQYPELRQMIRDVIARADQITDLYAVALGVFGSKKAMPMAIKRGVADVFNKFNEYQFSKYNTSSGVKLRDVLRIVHPKGSDEKQGLLFKKIMEDTLSTPYTWETQLSENGKRVDGEKKTKGQIWSELVLSGKVGYMALLRNLRNMWQEADFSQEAKETVYTRLADPQQVAKSKQFPFRFLNALDVIEPFHDTKLVRAISRALDSSVANLPKLGDGVWIIIDCSGSMGGNPIKTATFFGAALAKANAEAKNVAITMFSDYAKACTVNTDDSVLSITKTLSSMVFGGGTNMKSAIDYKSKLGFEPDTVIVISDMQINSLNGANVDKLFQPNIVKIAMNLGGHESTPLSEISGWYQLAGYSDRIFDFIPALREKVNIVDLFSYRYHGLPKKQPVEQGVEKETE